MKIEEFISNYKNHPVLFIGTGISLRYLKKDYLIVCHYQLMD
jgi:hypothetical protein